MKKLLLSFLAISMSALVAQAFSIEALRFHCADDTTRINQILHEAVSNTSLKSAGSYMSFFADKLLGTPYVAHTLEGDREYLSINVDQLDCTTFVETLPPLLKPPKRNPRHGMPTHPHSKASATTPDTSTATPHASTTSAHGLSKTPTAATSRKSRQAFRTANTSQKQSTTCRHTATTTPRSPTAPPLKASGILKPATTAICIHT